MILSSHTPLHVRTPSQGLAAELASQTDDELMRRLECPTGPAAAHASVEVAEGHAALTFAVGMRLLLCPEQCLSPSRTACICPDTPVESQAGHVLDPTSLPDAIITRRSTVPPPPPARRAPPGAMLYSLPSVTRHGLPASTLDLAWRAPLHAQHLRLLLPGASPDGFWMDAWRFYSDASCTEPLYPDDARDSGHEGCCATGCIKGVEVGACCCERLHRARPCAAGACWVEVDFGATVEVACMEYSSSGGAGDATVRLEVWQEKDDVDGGGAWTDPVGAQPLVSPLPRSLPPAPPHFVRPPPPPPPSIKLAATPPPPPPPARRAPPGAMLYSLPSVTRHGLPASTLDLAWRAPLHAQHLRLLLPGASPDGFWMDAWRFYSDASCTEPLYPDDARDSGHEGCCATGCIKGVEVGACCCERLHRARPCAAGACWVEVDFGATVEVACMEYSSSGGGRAMQRCGWRCGKMTLMRALRSGRSLMTPPQSPTGELFGFSHTRLHTCLRRHPQPRRPSLAPPSRCGAPCTPASSP